MNNDVEGNHKSYCLAVIEHLRKMSSFSFLSSDSKIKRKQNVTDSRVLIKQKKEGKGWKMGYGYADNRQLLTIKYTNKSICSHFIGYTTIFTNTILCAANNVLSRSSMSFGGFNNFCS